MEYPIVHTISFHDAPVQILEKGGSYYVPMKPLCQKMGLDWDAQRKLIQRDPVLSSVAVMITATGTDGKNYEMTSLPIEYLNGWLFKLDITRYPQDMQEKLIRYQKECYGVLFRHFFKKPSDTLSQIREIVREETMKLIPSSEDRVFLHSLRVSGKYPSLDEAKAALAKRGYTMSKWAVLNGFGQRTVNMALHKFCGTSERPFIGTRYAKIMELLTETI